MARIKFNNGKVEDYTFVLSTRSHKHLGQIANVEGNSITVRGNMNAANEISFVVHKTLSKNTERLWDDIIDLRLVYVKELNEYFEIKVSLNDSSTDVKKTITGTSLCECELSQTLLWNIHINDEDDIARDEYKIPTVFYRNLDDCSDESDYQLKKSASLLHRILNKTPHYKIKHVDESLKNLQRTFSVDGTSVYDFFQGDCAEQFNCLFQYDSTDRSISVYDLYTVCQNPDCHYRGEFNDVCPECEGTDLKYYGEDTTILVDKENLTDEITFEADADSIKNCFKLTAGDDDMTAAIININPNGTDYIYYLSDEQKTDMSLELVEKIKQYDEEYANYTDEYKKLSKGIYDAYDEIAYYTSVKMPFDSEVITLSTATEQLTKINVENMGIIGVNGYNENTAVSDCIKEIISYATALIDTYNYTVKFDGLLSYVGLDVNGNKTGNVTGRFTVVNRFNPQDTASNTLVITVNDDYNHFLLRKIDTITSKYENDGHDQRNPLTVYDSTSEKEAAKLTVANLSPIGIQKVESYTSVATVNSAIKNYAKIYVKTGYFNIDVNSGELSNELYTKPDGTKYRLWVGNFKVTNNSLENDDEGKTALSRTITIEVNDNYETFLKQKVEKTILAYKENDDDNVYDVLNINDLDKFKDALSRYCLHRLTSFHEAIQGAIDVLLEANGSVDANDTVYNYYTEIYANYYNKLLSCQEHIDATQAVIDEWNNLYEDIASRRNDIQTYLNFEDFIGEELYQEFCAYRREDEYSNSNYISDGLNNAEIFEKAEEFFDLAKKEIFKSGERQHSISSNLHNLLAIKEFAPVVDKFELGNWIRIKVDGQLYRLRLSSYEIAFSSIQNINVGFTDLTKTADGMNDIKSILSKSQSISSSYGYVSKQASQGEKANSIVANFREEGLNSALYKIKNSDSEEVIYDTHGLLCRSYDDVTESYSDEQLRFVHNVLAFTDDNWKTVRTALGKMTYTLDGIKYEEYGLNSDFVISGKIIAGDIYSGNYSSANNKGSHINLNDGTFSMADGNLVWDGNKLIFGNDTSLTWDGLVGKPDNLATTDDIPSDEYITNISKNAITSEYIKGLNLEVGNQISMGANAKISWNNVTNHPTIPTNTDQLINGAGFQTASQVTTITKNTVTAAYINAFDITASSLKANTVLAGRVEAQNLKITGGSVEMTTDNNIITLKTAKKVNSQPMSQLDIKSELIKMKCYFEGDGSSAEINISRDTGISYNMKSSQMNLTAGIDLGSIYCNSNGKRVLTIQGDEDGYARYNASVGHGFYNNIVLHDGDIIFERIGSKAYRSLKQTINALLAVYHLDWKNSAGGDD